ncbi:MAG: DUF3108 domain-containing protein [Bacteroidota bacterium]
MIARVYICTMLWLGLSIAAMAQPTSSTFREVQNKAFQKGEYLKYRIHYGIIDAGIATLEVRPKSYQKKGRNCLHIVCKNETVGLFDTFYRVRDTYESYTDEKALISWQFNRDIQEGSYKSYREIHFDHKNQKAEYHRSTGEVVLHDVPVNVQDVISTYYFARASYDHKKLEPGDKISLRNFIDETNFELQAQVQKRETIKVNGQKYKALRLKIMIEEAGLITDGSKITLWISDDKNMIPLAFKSKLLIGSIRADLVEYKNLKNPFEARTS